MKISVVFLALVAFASAVPFPTTQQAADQSLLKKQQQILVLLKNIIGEIPDDNLASIGHSYDIESNLHNYENPNLVKFLVIAVQTGNIQPKCTAFSLAVSQLRQEVVLLTRILLGAKDYQTFINTAVWARVHLNEQQFVIALVASVFQRPDCQGILLPALYEIIPQDFFDIRVIQEVQNIKATGIKNSSGTQEVIVPINYTSHLPSGEYKVAYFTEDIGLNHYLALLDLTGWILTEVEQQEPTRSEIHGSSMIGHGARWIYLQQQVLAHYNLERLGNNLGPVPELNSRKLDIPLKTHLGFINGLELPGRSAGPIDLSVIRPELTEWVRILEKRVVDAIDSGYVVTPHGSLLALFRPQGLNILGDLIEGTGRSINPRYYGSFLQASKVLLGGSPEYDNIWEYTPSALELSTIQGRDPALYVLMKHILKLVERYQKALPAYQYNDIVLDGVQIQKVDVSQLMTYFQDYIVDLKNAGILGVNEAMQRKEQQGGLDVKALMKRLDHQPYEIRIMIQCQKPVSNAVIRLFLGPKFDHNGSPIDVNANRLDFVELDQWIVDLAAGQNVITRNSKESTMQSMDIPSVDHIEEQVERAISSQKPLYITQLQQLTGFPARLSLPKGKHGGNLLQLLIVISAGQTPLHYGPVIPDSVNSFHSNQWQVVNAEEYNQISNQPAKNEGQISVDVVPDLDILGVGMNQGKWCWTDLYNRPQGYYNQPQWHHFKQLLGVGQTVRNLGSSDGESFGHGMNSQGIVGGQGMMNERGFIDKQGMIGGGEVSNGGIREFVMVAQTPTKHRTLHGIKKQVVKKGAESMWSTLGGGVSKVSGMQQEGQDSGMVARDTGFEGVNGVYGNFGGITGAQGGLEGVIGAEMGVQSSTQKSAAIVQKYYNNLPVSHLIGGAISLDGKPLGWPLDRPLSPSVWSVPNMCLKDVIIYHQDVPMTRVVGH